MARSQQKPWYRDDCKRYGQKNANDGYVYVVDMDLEKFFDNICQSKLIEVLSRTIKDGRVISLIHKYMNAGAVENGLFERRAIYWKQWKKVCTRIRKLRSLNLPEWVVFEIANCRKGIWRSALVLNQALTNKEIANLGYMSLTGYYLQVREN